MSASEKIALPLGKLCVESLPWRHKEKIRCLFCGGKLCKRCGPTAYENCGAPGLQRVHSSWITESILAMQRPTEELVDGDAKLIEQFKSSGITALFNLTEPGEHPYCGSGLRPSGFTYTPERFMSAGSMLFFIS